MIKHLINGSSVESKETFETVNPASTSCVAGLTVSKYVLLSTARPSIRCWMRMRGKS